MLSRLIVLVEEPSAEAALGLLLPKLVGGAELEIHAFNGKTDLLRKLPERLCGYARWLPADWGIVVLVDRDDDDCRQLKATLDRIALDAGLIMKTAAGGRRRFQVLNRLMVEELEAWFFGDWEAVCAAYPKLPATVPERRGMRDPDAIAGGTWECYERVLRQSGYFTTGLRKIENARKVATHMNPARNRSPSFMAFADGLAAMLSDGD